MGSYLQRFCQKKSLFLRTKILYLEVKKLSFISIYGNENTLHGNNLLDIRVKLYYCFFKISNRSFSLQLY